MTLATITEYLEVGNPSYEVVQLTLDDGDTYVSRKFDLVLVALASGNEDNDFHINCEISTKTVTINYASASAQKITLFLCGTTGP